MLPSLSRPFPQNDSPLWRSSGVDAAAKLLLLSVIYLLINFVLTANVLAPVHQDDYLALGGEKFHLLWPWPRPVSSNLIAFAGSLGPSFAYGLLNALVVVVPFLTLLMFERIFALRTSLVVLLLFGVVVFSHQSAFEHGKFLGVITNLSSHFFGTLALLLLWDGWKRRGWVLACLAILALGLSILAKEDFVIPPGLLLGYLWLEDWRTRRRVGAPRWWPSSWHIGLTLAVGVAMLASVVFALLLADNPFVAGLTGTPALTSSYAVGLTPAALLDAFKRLTIQYALIPTAMGLAAFVVGMIALPGRRIALLLVATVIGALMLPYALLPNNMPSFRVFSWLAWLAGLICVVLQLMAARFGDGSRGLSGRAVAIVVSVGTLALAGWVYRYNQVNRAGLVGWYQAQQQVNATILQTLNQNRALLDEHAMVGIVGLDGLSPWSNTNAEYLRNRLVYDNRWIVFVEADSIFFKINSTIDDTWAGGKLFVSVRKVSRVCEMPNLPVLEFDPSGHARATLGSEVCARLGQSGAAPAL